MRAFYLVVIAIMLVVIGMLFYPPLREVFGYVDTSGFLPLTEAAVTFMPYVFLLFIVYGIVKQARGGD